MKKLNEKNVEAILISRRSGITLISLVITIIILLILAGAVVTIALNGDSIFGKSNRAVKEWNRSAKAEQQSIWDNLDWGDMALGEVPDIRATIDNLPEKKSAAELSTYIPIYTSEQLQKVATGESIEIEGQTYTMAANAKYALMRDLNNVTMTPIKGFTGEFEGNGCTITGLNIDTREDGQDYTNPIGSTSANNKYHPAGLFECITGGTVKNLAIVNADIKAQESVGAIAGQGDNVTIENCYVKDSTLAGNSACAAVIGFLGNNGGNISKCKVISTTVSRICCRNMFSIIWRDRNK